MHKWAELMQSVQSEEYTAEWILDSLSYWGQTVAGRHFYENTKSKKISKLLQGINIHFVIA